MAPLLRPSLVALPLFLCLGCAWEDPGNGLGTNPAEPVVRVGERLTLQALSTEPLAEDPTWEVLEFHGGGFLNSRGSHVTYLAPEGANSYHLVLRARRFDGVPMKRVVLLQVLPVVLLHPTSVKLPPGGTCGFTAKVRGTPLIGVEWAVEEPSGGTIVEDGTYTAPETRGTYHVIATAKGNADARGSAVVEVK